MEPGKFKKIQKDILKDFRSRYSITFLNEMNETIEALFDFSISAPP
jgi:hypothetical protein